jgi:NDP-sugar pyrophosphorylase family protein
MTKSKYFKHPLAVVESKQIGKDTRVWGWVHIMEEVSIGENCNVGEHCFIENGVKIGSNVTIKNNISIWDGVQIEDDVFLGPNVIFTNVKRPRSFIKLTQKEFIPTFIEKGATVGAGSVIVCGIKIGRSGLGGTQRCLPLCTSIWESR